MLANVEAQIIVREEQGWGLVLFEAVLKSLVKQVGRIVIVDNECDEAVRDMYHSIVPRDRLSVAHEKGRHSYSYLRNKGLAISSSQHEWVLFVDSDELYCDGIFEEAKPYLQKAVGFVAVPLNYLSVAPCFLNTFFTQKHRYSGTTGFWRKVPGGRFSGSVHEQCPPRQNGEVFLSTPCIHFWTTPQWQKMLKSLRYQYLEKKNFKVLEQFYNQDPDMTPNNWDWQRMHPYLVPYSGPWYGLTDFVKQHGGTKESWTTYLEAVEDYSFWCWWQQQYREKGSWIDTFEVAYEKFFSTRT